MVPMVANCASCSAVAFVFAPRVEDVRVAAVARRHRRHDGRAFHGPDGLQHEVRHRGERAGIAGADHAPARPSFTRSMAMRIEESLRRRMASRGCSDMPTTVAPGARTARARTAGGTSPARVR
jgi:hypothetical protein